MVSFRTRALGLRTRAPLACLAVAVGVLAAAATAQTDANGSLVGQVYDGQTGKPVAGATLMLTTAPPEAGAAGETSAVAGADGNFEFGSLPVGSYRIGAAAPGYQESTADAVVRAGEASRADIALEPLAAEAPALPEAPAGAPPTGATDGEVIDYEEFIVQGTTIEMEPIQLRIDSDELLNILGAEEFAKFAAGDVAEGIKRVAGVNVVEGQFAIIRGLEDRYSSTTYNGAPVPSPDPNRQSVQLDLFPSEIVNNLVVAKTFAPDLPSNSAGGSIDVITGQYPEEPELKIKGKAGYNENAIDRFLELEDGNPVGIEIDGFGDTWEREAGAFLGGRSELAGRELRFKLLGNWEIDYDTAEGYQEDREPADYNLFPPDGDLARERLSLTGGLFDLTTSDREEQQTGFGAAGFDLDEAGNHSIDVSLFWTRKDQDAVQLEENGHLAGYDYLQPGGPVDLESVGSPVSADTFVRRGSGNGNATVSSWIIQTREGNNLQSPNVSPLWFSSFFESKSFETERDLLVPQINGDHVIDAVPGLHLSWAANYARTTQTESARGARMWYEPCGYGDDPRLVCPDGVTRIDVPTVFPVTVASLGPGTFIGDDSVFANWNDIDEDQWFGRLDGDYETDVTDWLAVTLRAGGWIERASREVDANFVDQLNVVVDSGCVDEFVVCGGDQGRPSVFGDTPETLGHRLFADAFLLDQPFQPIRETRSEADREIEAIGLGTKTTLWEDLDLLGGVRLESIFLESRNDPFVEGVFDTDNSPLIYPSKFLMFDPLGDNPDREPRLTPPYNYEVLGLSLPSGPCRVRSAFPGQVPTAIIPGTEGQTCIDLVSRAEIEQLINGTIDEDHVLPAVGFTWRPLDGLAVRGAWSQTVARPSLREMGYYASVEPASDDVIVGNPQLQLSDVESWDARLEYVYGDLGELVAVSGFYKTIEDPIESIILRDPTNFLDDLSSALYRTFFNNPNEATLWGIEVEARKNLGFAGRWAGTDFLDHFTIGGNFTWIDAEVDRTQAELARSIPFFTRNSGRTLDDSRRLFGQPEWIANADVTFEHPDWGTRITLAYYAISDVLDAAGAVTSELNGEIIALTLDRYVDSFHTLDLVLSQEIWGGVSVKINAKNLTDSERAIVYDPEATGAEYEERAYKEGREYSLELSYSFSGGDWPFPWPRRD
jgi:outer membrane receptor protein involved in Fe transport